MLNESSVLIFTRGYPPAYRAGGPVRTIEALVRETQNEYALRIITADADLRVGSKLPVVSNEWVTQGKTKVWYASVNSLFRYFRAIYAGKKTLPNIIYLNSFFDVYFSIIPRMLRCFNFFSRSCILLAPRGEFGSGALSLKRRKKRLLIGFYRIFRLDRSMYWHASSDIEARDIRRVFPAARILVKEDETSLPARASEPTRPTEHLRLVFLGRISPMKGLDILLEGLASYPADGVEISLQIYGTEEDPEHVQHCKVLAQQLPINIDAEFAGSVRHGNVREILREFDFMLMPTRGENFGHVIAESLSVSLPVVCSDLTPWTPVLSCGGGLVIRDNEPASWCAAVVQLSRMSAKTKNELKADAGIAYAAWRNSRDRESIFAKLDRTRLKLDKG